MVKVKTLCRQVGVNQPLDDLLRRLNPALRGWCAYCVSRGHVRWDRRAVGSMA
jgi:hypothetical protein